MEDKIDPTEAPEGYYAVSKKSVDTGVNFCRHCDWRPNCDGTVRCCDYELANGMKRKDGCSVVFKKKVGFQPV